MQTSSSPSILPTIPVLSTIDAKIIAILDCNARLPINAIAKKIRENKETVRVHIRALEASGIIAGYYPMLNLAKLGFSTHRLNISTQVLSSEQENVFLRFLDKTLHCGLIYSMDQEYNYGVFLWTKSMDQVVIAVQKIKEYLGADLLKHKYAFMHSAVQFPRDRLVGNAVHAQQITPLVANISAAAKSLTTARKKGASDIVSSDEHDVALLQCLSENARMSTLEISSHTKIPQTTVVYRLRQLEKNGIIIGYRAQIDGQKLGLSYYAMEIYLKDQSQLKSLEHYLRLNKHTTWLQHIVGECDLEIETEVGHRDELDAFLIELRDKFSSIRKISFFQEKYHKITYVPA